MMQLRHREVKEFAEGHTHSKLNQTLWPGILTSRPKLYCLYSKIGLHSDSLVQKMKENKRTGPYFAAVTRIFCSCLSSNESWH